MFYKFKIIFFILTFSLIGSAGFAADIYVDQTLSQNITDGKYSIDNRNSSGSDGDAYTTLQGAISAVQAGDTIYMRGGTYNEFLTMNGIESGTSSAWITLTSYPSEWAIIDGQHAASDHMFEYDGSTNLRYWKFERFEVTGGGVNTLSVKGTAFDLDAADHLIFRYMYIHDNLGTGQYVNGGINLRQEQTAGQNILIEYCYFKDNGATDNPNCSHINFFSDYVENPLNVTNRAARDNEVRYNLFEGSSESIHYKNMQYLCVDDHTGEDMSNKASGDKIHHNIFINQGLRPIFIAQDFIQIYNNIMIDTEGNNTQFMIQGISEDDREPFYATVYNNLIKNIKVGIYHDGNNGGTNDNSNYAIPSEHKGRPYFYFYNNIIENAGSEFNGRNDLNILFTYSSWTENDIDMSSVHVENNLFYGRSSTDEIIDVGDDTNDYSAVGYKSKGYSSVLYTSQDNGLHPAGESFKCVGSFLVDGTKTIEDGGIGGNHPYLSGITLPSYIGAVNPKDDAWVDGVLGLNAQEMKNASEDDPSWIEGGQSSDPGSLQPPSGLQISPN